MGINEETRLHRGRAASLVDLVRGRAAKSAVVAALVLGGGTATAITAFANTGHVTASESCTSWTAAVSLDNNVTRDKIVDVLVTGLNGTQGLAAPANGYDTTGNSGPVEIWHASGAAPATGTVTLEIKNSNGTQDSSSPYTKSLAPATGCTSTPTIATTPSGASVALGSAIHDVATVTGSSTAPTGTVTFKLFAPSNATCDSEGAAAVYTSDPVTLVAGSTAGQSTATGGSFTPTAPGTYHWVASYSGDGGHTYNAVSSACADEAVAIGQAGPAITTVAAGGTGLVGNTIHDTATVSGRINPLSTDTVTFQLFGAGDSTCAQAPVQTSSVALSATATSVDSPDFTTTAAGTYHYEASYSGDTNNAPATSACGAANEAVVITAPGGTQGITTPSTGTGTAVAAVTMGGFLFLGGLGVALLGMMPKRRDNV